VRAAIAILAVVLGLTGIAQAANEAAAERDDRGLELLKQGKTTEAVDEFLKAVELNPKDTVSRSNLAAIYEREGRFDEAVYHYEKIVSVEPRNPTAHNNLGVLYDRKQLFAEAIREFEAVLEIDPKNSLAAKNIEVTRSKQAARQERERQIATAKQTAEAKPDNPAALYNLARTYAFYGDNEKALSSLEKALKLGFNDLAYLKVDAALQGLRDDPSYRRLIAGR
jgi:Flp pilus assembly protein TadD